MYTVLWFYGKISLGQFHANPNESKMKRECEHAIFIAGLGPTYSSPSCYCNTPVPMHFHQRKLNGVCAREPHCLRPWHYSVLSYSSPMRLNTIPPPGIIQDWISRCGKDVSPMQIGHVFHRRTDEVIQKVK